MKIFTLILTILLFYGGLTSTELMADEIATPSAITITGFGDVNPVGAHAFAAGATQDELAHWFTNIFAYFTAYDTQGNELDVRSNAWSFTEIDTTTPGLYYAWVLPHLADNHVLADGVSLPQQGYPVSIQTPGKLTINTSAPGRGFLFFPWVFSLEQSNYLDKLEALGQADTFATVWLRQDHGIWSPLNEGVTFVSDALHLSQSILEYGSHYDLQVDYPGGQTGILTFQYSWPLNILNYAEGDRDGGDVNGSGSSTGSQPAPAPSRQTQISSSSDQPHYKSDNHSKTQYPLSSILHDLYQLFLKSLSNQKEKLFEPLAEPHETTVKDQPLPNQVQLEPSSVLDQVTFDSPASFAESAPVYATSYEPDTNNDTQTKTVVESPDVPLVEESYTPEETIISSLRLRDLCTHDENIVFGSGDLTVSIPSKALLELNLLDSDTLSVKLTQPENNQIMLGIEISGQPVTDLPQTILRLRYIPESNNPEIIVENQLKEKIKNTVFNGEVLSFTVNKPGLYTIFETPTIQTSEKEPSPIFPFYPSLILATGVIIFFRWKRHE